MEKTFKWGIIGPGMIANKFASAVITVPGAELGAICSRSKERAAAFADKFGIPKQYLSAKEIAADPGIDAVYIAVPNPFHFENIMTCLEAGKPVLCEKPFTLNSKEAKAAVQYAREKKVFLMEAVWTRCLPTFKKVREWLDAGKIGDVRLVTAQIGFFVPWPEGDRHINPALGGGGLLDVGIYNIAFASWVYGRKPQKVTSYAQMGKTGVDMQATLILDYGNDQMAVLTTSLLTDMPNDGYIYGSKGHIYLKEFWHPTTAVLAPARMPFTDTVYCPFTNGFEFEIMEVMKCVREGKTECPLNTLDETISYSEILDEARAQWGFKFPQEV